MIVSKIIPYYMIPYGFGALLYAPLSRVIHYKYIFSVTMLIYGLMSLYCSQVSSLEQFRWGRMAMGLSGASAIPLGLIIIGDLFKREWRGRLVGFMFSCSFISSIAGLFISGFVDWRWLFFVPAIIGILTGAIVLLMPSKILKQKHTLGISYKNTLRNALIRNVFYFYFYCQCFVSWG